MRTQAAQGQDREQLQRIVAVPCDHRHAPARGDPGRLPRLQREAQQLGRINIQDGAKGGRCGASAPRWIRVNDPIREALTFAAQASPKGSRNLLAGDETYQGFQQTIVRPARNLLHQHGLKGFHELRAAYGCTRYEQLTQHPTPLSGDRGYQLNRPLDTQARSLIGYELGHGRIDVVAAYIGGRV